MKIDIITLFPDIFKGPFSESIIKRAQKKGLVKIDIHNLRDWAQDKHRTVDDKPYGGGPGMIIKADVVYRALRNIAGIDKKIKKPACLSIRKAGRQARQENKKTVILPTPKGKKFDQCFAQKLSKKKHLIFLCPHYEGYDHRIESFVDEKISIGDYILTGGELPAMVMVDAIVRLIPGVIRKESLKEESFSMKKIKEKNNNETMKQWNNRIYEYPQYTRPEILEVKIRGKKIKKRVPKVLLSGNHAKIEKWRKSKMRS